MFEVVCDLWRIAKAVHVGWLLAVLAQSADADWPKLFRPESAPAIISRPAVPLMASAPKVEQIFAQTGSDNHVVAEGVPRDDGQWEEQKREAPPPPTEVDLPRKIETPVRLTPGMANPLSREQSSLGRMLANSVTISNTLPKAIGAAPPKVQLLAYMPDWCIVCWKSGSDPLRFASDQTKLRPLLNADCPVAALIKHPAFDVKIVVEENKNARYYPAVKDIMANWLFYRNHMDTPEELIENINKLRARGGYKLLAPSNEVVTAGNIDGDLVLQVLSKIEDGLFLLPNKPGSHSQGWFSFGYPSHLKGDIETIDGIRRITFDESTRPTTGLGMKMLSVSGIEIDDRRAILKIDWWPDQAFEF